MPAQNHVTGDRRVQARGFEAIGPWEVHQPVGPPGAGADETPLLALYSDSRIVRHLLAAASEAIEESRLAAIGHPDERQTGESGRRKRLGLDHRGVHKVFPGREISTPSAALNAGVGGREVWTCALTSTQMFSASQRRRASVVLPTRTTNGSRPGRVSAMISTSTPVQNT